MDAYEHSKKEKSFLAFLSGRNHFHALEIVVVGWN